MVINAAVGLIAFVVITSEARLPPKFVKAASGAGKALYASRYGYSTIPIPAHIVLQTNLNRKEVHLTGSRGRRPTTKRPRRRPEYASKYQDYIPKGRVQKKKPKGVTTRPTKRRPTHKHPYKEPEYYDQDDLDDDIDDSEYEYDSRGKKYRDNYEYEDFGGHQKTRSRRRKKKNDEEGAHSEAKFSYTRKPQIYIKNYWSGTRKPSNKLYSTSTLDAPVRSKRIRDEERHIYEEDDGERRPIFKDKQKRLRNKHEGRYREDEEDNYKAESGRNRNRDSYYNSGEKSRERDENNKYHGKRKSQYRERDYENERDVWDEGNRERDKYDLEEAPTRNKPQKSRPKDNDVPKKWAEDDEEEVRNKEKEKMIKEIPITHITPQLWTTQMSAHIPTWSDVPFPIPSVTPIVVPTHFPINWNNQFPNQNNNNWYKPNQSVYDAKWIEAQAKGQNWGQKINNQNEVANRQNVNNGMTIAHAYPMANFEWKPETIREGEITEHEKWKIQNFPHQSTSQIVQNNPQPQSTTIHQPQNGQWPQTNTISASSGGAQQPIKGDIVYGSRFQDTNAKKKEPDIGYGQGMEVFDNRGSWQVY
ncbi:hypothetical protein O3M35_001917 [Rhynocoris fuscipes]|uniref:Uncharacterized protein n=1 Tax=Rhynocoris fuscipes TaxID=488301 RepID=A0AAW1CQA5_9HEMI